MAENNLEEVPNAQKPAQNLLLLIKRLIQEEHYEGVKILFTGETEAQRNIECLEDVSSLIYQDVCLVHLTDSNHNNNLPLYVCAEEILKILAKHGPVDELILELLDIIEEEDSDNVFTSALRALQIALLRLGENKPRVLQWSYNSVLVHVNKLPLPEYLSTEHDAEKWALLEQNAEVERVLMSYITVCLFYEDLLKDAITTLQLNNAGFRDCSINRRNVLCCFLLKLLGRPLALLDLNDEKKKTNTYTMQVAKSLTKCVTECIVDPLFFFKFLEIRKGVIDKNLDCKNIFLMEETLPTESLGTYYYMLLVQKVGIERVPKVYTPLYVFSSLFILSANLAYEEEPVLHLRSLLLSRYALQQLESREIPFDFLKLQEFPKMMERICEFCASSPHESIRHLAPVVLTHYILQFEPAAQIALMNHLLDAVTYDSLRGFIIIITKDVCNAKFSKFDDSSKKFINDYLNNIVFKKLCILPNGVQSDILNTREVLVATLNVLIYFGRHHSLECTNFMELYPIIEKTYLQPLRHAINFTVAHWKQRIDQCEKGLDTAEDAKLHEQLQMMNIKISNDRGGNDGGSMVFSKEKKLEALRHTANRIDLVLYLLSTLSSLMEEVSEKKLSPIENN